MGKYFDGNVIISMCLVSAVFVNCIPTSVLIDSKASNVADNNKGKILLILLSHIYYNINAMVMDGPPNMNWFLIKKMFFVVNKPNPQRESIEIRKMFLYEISFALLH